MSNLWNFFPVEVLKRFSLYSCSGGGQKFANRAMYHTEVRVRNDIAIGTTACCVVEVSHTKIKQVSWV